MNIWNFLTKNIYIKNIFWAIVIIIALFLGLKWWLNIYTRHGQAVLVPDVKGLTIEEATPFFHKNNLNIDAVGSVNNKNVKPGVIIETVPTANTKVKEHRNIYITVNDTSSRKSVIPEVKNQSLKIAISKLKAVDFNNIQVKYVPDAGMNWVLGLEHNGREVNAGQRLAIESKLVLLVGDGSEDINNNNLIESNTEVSVDESWLN